jgi:hypothetical protein
MSEGLGRESSEAFFSFAATHAKDGKINVSRVHISDHTQGM